MTGSRLLKIAALIAALMAPAGLAMAQTGAAEPVVIAPPRLTDWKRQSLAWPILRWQYNNLRIPEDFSVIGFDDTPIAVKIWPALTTVRQPLQQIAEVATRHLVERLRTNDDEAPGGTDYVDYQIVERDSVTGPAD